MNVPVSDALSIIDQVIAEHHKIRNNMKLVGESLNDVEASFLISHAFADWTQSSVEELAARRDKLMQAVSAMTQGLTTHFGFEEKYLPPLFGELLMKALVHEHKGVRGRMETAHKSITSLDVAHLDSKELVGNKTLIQNNLNNLMQSVEEHAGHEEIILNMIKHGLEGSGKQPG